LIATSTPSGEEGVMTVAKRTFEPCPSARRLGVVVCASVVLLLGAVAPASAATASQLLSRYTPTLKYEAGGDGFRADSAAEITNNYVSTDGSSGSCPRISGPSYSNYLMQAQEPPAQGFRGFAASDPRLRCPTLNLRFLGPTYPNGVAANVRDFLDEHNGTESHDAARLHRNPAYRNQVYGRAIRSGGRLWLQYWFFYYFNPQNEAGIGVHEGDWEMIELGVNDNGLPFRASYAQHDGHEVCPWSDVFKNGTSPLVYVADGSHASYFSSGVERRGFLPDDNHHGNGPAASPNATDPAAHLTLKNISKPGPRWLRWPGKWGASGASPSGPKFQDAWTHPKGHAQSTTSGAHSCVAPT
jgi:hypothetical protein